MIRQESLWSRIGQRINPFHRDEPVPDLARKDSRLLNLTSSTAEHTQRTMPAAPWWRRDRRLKQAQPGYDKILELVESIQDHLSRQSQRGAEVTTLLNHVTGSLQELPSVTSRQADTLSTLAEHIDASRCQQQAIMDALRDLPPAAQAQRVALDSVANQVQSSSAATEKLSTRIEAIGEVLATLGDSMSRQVQALHSVQEVTRQRETQWVTMMERQQRRFTVLLAAVLALVILAAGTITISLFS